MDSPSISDSVQKAEQSSNVKRDKVNNVIKAVNNYVDRLYYTCSRCELNFASKRAICRHNCVKKPSNNFHVDHLRISQRPYTGVRRGYEAYREKLGVDEDLQSDSRWANVNFYSTAQLLDFVKTRSRLGDDEHEWFLKICTDMVAKYDLMKRNNGCKCALLSDLCSIIVNEMTPFVKSNNREYNTSDEELSNVEI